MCEDIEDVNISVTLQAYLNVSFLIFFRMLQENLFSERIFTFPSVKRISYF